jgi:hypothetical protein
MWAATLVAVPVVLCAGERVTAAEAPKLFSITPASGPSGAAYPLQAMLHGADFEPAGNSVRFGPVQISDLSSADGSSIVFAVPKQLASRGEVPPMVLPPGNYAVTVTTKVGTSNALNFVLTDGP